MTDPLRVRCESVADMPSVKELEVLARANMHVVLQFPRSGVDKLAVVNRLSRDLPEHTVFESGGDANSEWITVKSVVSRPQILDHLPFIRAALKSYFSSCASLLKRYESGDVPDEWYTDEHGEHVLFENVKTGQTIEVPLDGPPSLEDVDPYFFSQFVCTSEAHPRVSQLIDDYFHDGARIIEVINELVTDA